MNGERYVVVGLAHVRSGWFTEVARWATSGSLPVEFVKCLSPEELRVRLASGRPFSGALLDGRLPAVDRDLLATLTDLGIPSLVVQTGKDDRDWAMLGGTATLPDPLTRSALLDLLATYCQMIGAVDDAEVDVTAERPASVAWRGRLVAVTGRPGMGVSTLAVALAQDLGDDPRYAGDVVLADLARHAHQAVLHDARDVVPGIQELVEAHRSGRPTIEQIRHLSFDVAARRYRLVLGLRRPRDWVTIRSRAFGAALDGLRRSARIVVADTDADLEGESDTGSFDIEDRNLMARATTRSADLVVVVASPSTSGIHGLIGQLEDLRGLGIPGERTLVVMNRGPRLARARAELTRAVASLADAASQADPYLGPVYVSERRNVDRLHEDLSRFPPALTEPIGRAVRDLLDRLPTCSTVDTEVEAIPIAPGTLGRWTEREDLNGLGREASS